MASTERGRPDGHARRLGAKLEPHSSVEPMFAAAMYQGTCP